MPDLFRVSISEMIREVDRELALRRRLYPLWVESKKLTQEKADRQIEVMEAVRFALDEIGGRSG